MRIGVRTLEELLKRPGDAREIFWDDKTPGFGVRLGRGISYIVKFRVRGEGKQRFQTLGSYPELHPELAREQAEDIRRAAAKGRDLGEEEKYELAAEKKRRQDEADAEAKRLAAAIPISTLLDSWRSRTEQERDTKIAGGELARHEKEMLLIEARLLRPTFGALAISEYDAGSELQALLDRQGSWSAANNIRAAIVRIAKHINLETRAWASPARWPTKFELPGKPTKRWQHWSVEEVASLWVACGAFGRPGALARLMIITGCRENEAARVLWEHLRLTSSTLGPHWAQPPTSTKARREHLVPLSSPAVALIATISPRLAGPSKRPDEQEVSPLVFAGRSGKPFTGWPALKAALVATGKVKEGHLHDLRRSVATAMADAGIEVVVADKILNHASSATLPGVVGIYQRSELWDRRVAAMEKWAEVLGEAVARQTKLPLPEAWGLNEPLKDVPLARRATWAAKPPGPAS
ncbi:DUF4102 domain-containing protein [Rhodovarius crocodyli]|uniref:DUF4102 domain-containing protein n=1 Tax=Rhodovarius crocodyli TaxID=1979269 RepID=A0A437MFA4_9PROT|nr:tyrosine-type recombinase/integrase [Rhodovarius crocodyli]RVT96313.1 DUF4102 domain-containing protein [Rhodovarius crocodyli]